MAQMEFVLLVVAIGYLEAAKLPSYIVPCSIKDPNLNECALRHGQDSIKYILKGDPKYKIPNMLPLMLPGIKLSTNNLHINLVNVVLRGLEDSKIKDLRIDLAKQHISVTMLIDRVNIISDYDIKGSILVVPINGNGKANITIAGGEYTFKFDYGLIDKQGKTYVEIKNDDLKYTTKRSYFHFENLFGGDKALGDHINTFLNDQYKDIEAEIAPAIVNTITALVRTTIEGITNKVPYSEFLLP